jgi:F0F1-type ATP synthase assembly protein I
VAFLVAKPKEEEGLAGAQRQAAPYLDAVWQMVAALLMGAGLGVLMDRKLGTGPWGVVSGLGLGLGLGFWRLIRTLSSLGKQP